MKSMNGDTTKTTLSEQDVNLTKFRKRNKILIFIFLLLMISLAIIIGSLITLRVQNTPPYHRQVNPAVQAFCSVDRNTTWSCLKALNPIISVESRTDPNQILTLSLRTAANQLENIVSLCLSTSVSGRGNNESLEKCSNSSRVGLGHIRDALEKMRVNPFVETQSHDQRKDMTDEIMAAEENLNSCLNDLGGIELTAEENLNFYVVDLRRIEWTAVDEVRARVHQAKVYLSSSRYFLMNYALVMYRFYSDFIFGGRGVDSQIAFCGGLQLLFMFFLFFSLFRIR